MTEAFGVDVAFTRGDFRLNAAFALEPGTTLGIFGASGAGKTSLLRCIAGLEQATTGNVIIGGIEWQTDSMFMPTHERRVACVFQEPRLFPWSVRRNLEFAHQRADRDADWFANVVSALDIAPLMTRDVEGLSGGEAKRVAIARALLTSPHLLLMDEPTASLDHSRRQELLPYFSRLNALLNVPVIYISHDLDELIQLADRLLVIDAGQIVADGPLQDIVADHRLPGLDGAEAGVVLHGQALDAPGRNGLRQVEFDGGALWVAAEGLPASARLRIRANDVSVCRTRPTDSSILNLLDANIVAIEDESDVTALLRLRIGNQDVLSRITQHSRLALGLVPGEQVVAQIKSVAVRGGVSL